MKPERILMTADAVGGVWTYALELSRQLIRKGVGVALATMGPPPKPAQQAEAARIAGLELFTSAWKLEWMEEPWSDVERAGEWLLDLEQKVRPAIVHLNGYVHAALPWRAPVLVVGHSCVLSWWRAVHGEAAPDSWSGYREKVRAGLRAASMVVAPSRAMLDALIAEYGPLPRSGVIPNGRDPSTFPPGPKQPLIMTAGRLWDRAKNASALQEVAPALTWPVETAGEGGSLGELATSELSEWLGKASVYALPARYEPFGLSVLEAALAGCALVLGDIPSLRENWNGAALFVHPDDKGALLNHLKFLIRSEAMRTRLQQAARLRAVKFSTERMTASYLARYRHGIRSAAVRLGGQNASFHKEVFESRLQLQGSGKPNVLQR